MSPKNDGVLVHTVEFDIILLSCILIQCFLLNVVSADDFLHWRPVNQINQCESQGVSE